MPVFLKRGSKYAHLYCQYNSAAIPVIEVRGWAVR